MIKLVAKVHIKPECVEAFLEVAKPLIEGSQKEEGNIFYTLNRDLSDPCRFAFIECWKDQSAIDFHNATEHFKTGVAAFEPLRAEVIPLEAYEEID